MTNLAGVQTHWKRLLGQESGRLRSVELQLTVDNLCSADTFQIYMNGAPLHEEQLRRSHGLHHGLMLGADATITSSRPPTSGGPGLAMTLELGPLRGMRSLPRAGDNTLEFCLAARPEGLGGGVRVHKVELRVDYGAHYPSRL